MVKQIANCNKKNGTIAVLLNSLKTFVKSAHNLKMAALYQSFIGDNLSLIVFLRYFLRNSHETDRFSAYFFLKIHRNLTYIRNLSEACGPKFFREEWAGAHHWHPPMQISYAKTENISILSSVIWIKDVENKAFLTILPLVFLELDKSVHPYFYLDRNQWKYNTTLVRLSCILLCKLHWLVEQRF